MVLRCLFLVWHRHGELWCEVESNVLYVESADAEPVEPTLNGVALHDS